MKHTLYQMCSPQFHQPGDGHRVAALGSSPIPDQRRGLVRADPDTLFGVVSHHELGLGQSLIRGTFHESGGSPKIHRQTAQTTRIKGCHLEFRLGIPSCCQRLQKPKCPIVFRAVGPSVLRGRFDEPCPQPQVPDAITPVLTSNSEIPIKNRTFLVMVSLPDPQLPARSSRGSGPAPHPYSEPGGLHKTPLPDSEKQR